MSKAVLISIRPEWVEKIASGEKTVEVRKTRPKLETPFKCYIYCTKATDRLLTVMRDGDENYGEIYHGKPVFIKTSGETYGWLWHRQQQVVGEFVCDSVDRYIRIGFLPNDYHYRGSKMEELPLDKLCLGQADLRGYGNGKTLYGWHISGLKIYADPQKLSAYNFPPERYCEKGLCGGCPYDQVPNQYGEYEYDCEWRRPISRPPQSWCYVEDNG